MTLLRTAAIAVQYPLHVLEQLRRHDRLMPPVMALVPMKDQSDVEFVRQDTPHRHVGEPVITLVLTPAGGVGLGPIALAVDLLGRAPQALDLTRFYDLYPPEEVDLPGIPPGHLEKQHPVYQRMRGMFGLVDYSEKLVRRGRAGYYGLITYLDEKIGRLLDVLEETGQADNTLVVYCSDHGDMNGEHGMWRKSNFYDASSRVPLQIAWKGVLPAGTRREEVVSLVDLIATVVEAAGATTDDASLDGDSLLGLMKGTKTEWKNEAFSEYLAHGVARPMAMLRRGRYKLNYSLGDPPELYDMEADPNEFRDLALDPTYQEVASELQERLLARWNPEQLEQQVLRSQRERETVSER